jgi:large subunit ribosomal protein L16
MAKKKNKLISFPSKLKYKKPSKHLSNVVCSKITFKSTVGVFGRYVVQASKSGFMTRGQIEAVRVALRRPIKHVKNAKVWVLIKVDRIITKRSPETRMGKGKGAPSFQIVLIEKGQLLYEIFGPTFFKINRVFLKAFKKLPVPSVLVDLYNG